MKLDAIIDILKPMCRKLREINSNDNGTTQTFRNNYGRSKGKNLYTKFGDLIVEDDYVYFTIKTDFIPKNFDAVAGDREIIFKYYSKVRHIRLPCDVDEVVKIKSDHNIIDIKIKR